MSIFSILCLEKNKMETLFKTNYYDFEFKTPNKSFLYKIQKLYSYLNSITKLRLYFCLNHNL